MTTDATIISMAKPIHLGVARNRYTNRDATSGPSHPSLRWYGCRCGWVSSRVDLTSSRLPVVESGAAGLRRVNDGYPLSRKYPIMEGGAVGQLEAELPDSPGMGVPGAMKPGAMKSGAMKSGAMKPGVMPPGARSTGARSAGARSAGARSAGVIQPSLVTQAPPADGGVFFGQRFPSLTVATPRLFVRPLVVTDAKEVTEIFNDRQTQRWLPFPSEFGAIDGKAWCGEMAQERRALGQGDHYGVVRREDDHLIGCLWAKRTDWPARSTEVSVAGKSVV